MKKNKVVEKLTRVYLMIMSLFTMSSACMVNAYAFGDSVSIDTSKMSDANTLMENIIGILLTISRYVGIALLVYGVYEVVMSFMQNQPEAKTKGIIMCLCGVVLIALKSVLGAFGLS